MTRDPTDFVLDRDEPPGWLDTGLTVCLSASPAAAPGGVKSPLQVAPSPDGGFQVLVRFFAPEGTGQAGGLAGYRETLLALLERPECRQASFDLSDLAEPPPGLLGLLSSALRRFPQIELINPSLGIQEILQISQLTRRLWIRSGPDTTDLCRCSHG